MNNCCACLRSFFKIYRLFNLTLAMFLLFTLVRILVFLFNFHILGLFLKRACIVNDDKTSKSSDSESWSWSLSEVSSSSSDLVSRSSSTNLAKEILTREILSSLQSTTVGLTASSWWGESTNSSTWKERRKKYCQWHNGPMC